MRWSLFILLQCLLVIIAGSIIYLHKDRVIMIKSPPAALAQWYKPENKRQVWLHNMFKLRREMQAARFYADNNDAKQLEKWVARLSEHYLKIAEMVPEWQQKLDLEALADLQESAGSHRYQDVSRALDDLAEGCKACHEDYRAVTATMYRAPDFSLLEIGPSTSFHVYMEELAEQVNRIKIASEDGMQELALASLPALEEGINTLGESCSDCHEKDPRVYPDDTIRKTLASLEDSLKTGTLKDQGRELGTLAVLACARCHGTHRLAYDARRLFTDRQSWSELIRH